MNKKLKASTKYGLVLLITGVLFWLLFKDVPLSDFQNALSTFNYKWILLSVFFSVLSHFLRAWRWKLLLNSSQYRIRLSTSYYAVMIGYLMNSFFPRLGEVSRCGIAFKTDKVPMPFALGTVFTERFIDLIMLLIITVITFFLQVTTLRDYFLISSASTREFFNDYWVYILLAILLGLIALLILLKAESKREDSLFSKIIDFIRQGIQGVLSIGKVKNQKGFWLATIGIWVLYFLMMYVITFGSDLTKDIGILAALSILVMGSFGMASPTPNGLVTFHALVAGVLVLYGISKDDGIIFATILHTSQLLTILIIGSISLILVNIRQKKHRVESQQR